MKKKLMAVLLAAVMTAGSLAGCGGQDQSGDSALEQTTSEETGIGMEAAVESTEGEDVQDKMETESAETKPFKYGFISWGTADEHGRTLNAAVEWAVDAAGGEFVMDGSAITAESTVAAAENLIQSGCDMISFCTYAGEASVPQISKLCQENGVYWTMWDTSIADSDIAAMLENDPYYVGSTCEDNYQAGYDTLKAMVEQGASKIILFKYGVNIPTCDDRCDGAYAAAEDLGVDIVYEIIAPEDYKKATLDALVAYPDADGVLLAGSGTYASSAIAAFKEAGKEKYFVGAFDYYDQMGQDLASGDLTIINGGHMVTGTFSALMAINAYFGTPLSSEKYQIVIPYLVLKSKEDYDLYKQFASEGAAYTSEELQQFLVTYNPEMTMENFQEQVAKWSVDDIKTRKGE